MKSKHTNGFTLIEMVIIIAILAISSFSIAAFITNGMDAWVFVKSRENALTHARSGIERIVRELRNIRRPTSIITAADSECQFVNLVSQTVDFKQSGDALYRNSDLITTGLLTPEGLKFTYYDANLDPATMNQNIRYIKVRLAVVLGSQGVTLEDGAKIRNL